MDSWILQRRRLLQLGGLALAARALPAWAARARSPMPLEVRRPSPGVVEAALTAAPATVVAGGQLARLWTYNGSFPGPVLRVREGELLRLTFTNGLDEPTNLHFHGLHISPQIDDPFLHVAPGEQVVYEWEVPADAAGTYWYHPHLHGQVARQVFAGLAGPLVVESPLEHELGLHRAEEYLLVLKDLSLDGTNPEPHSPVDWLRGKEGDLVMVNGALNPLLVARRALLRLRFLNAGTARYYRLQLEGHPFHLIATDGGLIETPQTLDELLLAPGERAEVLTRLSGPGGFRLRALPYDRGGFTMGHGGHHPVGVDEPRTLATVIAPTWLPGGQVPGRLTPVEALTVPREATRRFVLTEGMMGRFQINGRSFDEKRVDARGELETTELWEIDNHGGMDHPFHLHTYPFQVVSRNGIGERFRAWKDTINVRPGENVRIAVPLRDFTGRTVFHCHILEHEDLGMMGVMAVDNAHTG